MPPCPLSLRQTNYSGEHEMPKIDIHTHILPAELPDWKGQFGYGGFIKLDRHAPARARMMRDDGKFFREIESNCWDGGVRLQECDGTGVDVQVLSTVPVLFSYWTKPEHGLEISRFLNDQLAETVATNPRRFIGLGTLPLQAPELAVKELERCMRELKFAGVQIGSHVNEWNLNEEALFPVFEAAQELGAAIFVHPWDMMGEASMQKYWLPWLVGMPAEVSRAICSMIFGGVFQRLPRLRVAFAHGACAFAATAGRVEHGFQCRPDLCAVDNDVSPLSYLGKFFVDSLVHDARALRFVLEMYGEDCIALGSDYPFPLGEAHPGELIESIPEFSALLKEKLLWRNALTWLAREAATLHLNTAASVLPS